MESQSYGTKPVNQDASWLSSRASWQKLRISYTPLQALNQEGAPQEDPLWRKLAAEAFDEWLRQMKAVYSSWGSMVFFLSSVNGGWLELRENKSIEDLLPRDAEPAARRISRRLIDSGKALCGWSSAEHGLYGAAIAFESEIGTELLTIGVISRASLDDGVAMQLYYTGIGYPAHLNYSIERHNRQVLDEQQRLAEQETRRRELLFEMAQDLYSKNDTYEVLSLMLQRIQEFYPTVKIDLLMTQDQNNDKLPVKPLRFNRNEDDPCIQAFMEGQIIVQKAEQTDLYEMAVPISGKQGHYGVLHLQNHEGPFDLSDIRALKVLSNAAGSAFENAKLYEQSNFLVNELRLINELTKQLNQSLKPNDIFQFASAELTQIFHADYCCILQLDKEGREFVVQASNIPSMLYEAFEEHYGYAGLVYTSREPVIVSDYWSNKHIESKLMKMTGARSLIAAPFLIQDEVHGVILVAHRVPGFFSYDNYKLLQVLASHIGLALANASLHAEVRRMVITDNLTGLYARHYLDEQIGLYQKKDFCGSLIVVDIDHFKKVNDTYGHQVGDVILKEVSKIIKSSIREGDIPARWGGEELAIYLPQVSTEQAERIANRIRTRVEEDTNPSVTVSCGVSEWNWQDERISVESLFYRSDMALYRAKHEGRNRVRSG